ncbi:hypothetical protein DFQ26_005801 [Actinomortierella ambigua]|nr:hypothetical protein DFQ26_005801 [Actinomortierella ambigua]
MAKWLSFTTSPRVIQWTSFVLGVLVMALSGSLFSFASLATDLKARFGFSSSDINLLASIGDTAMYVGFLIVGPIYDHRGERWTLITATVLTLLGYGGMYIAYAKTFGGLGFLMVLYCLAGVASTAGYLAALATSMANFPVSQSGTVSGILLAFFGLSATLFSQFKTHLFSGKDELGQNPEAARKGTVATQNYLLFLTIVTTAIYVIAAIFMVKIKRDTPKNVEGTEESPSASSIEVKEGVTSPPALSRSTTFTPSMRNGITHSSPEWAQSSSSTLDRDTTEKPPSARGIPGDGLLDDAAAVTTGPNTTVMHTAKEAWFNPYLVREEMRPKQLLVESSFWFFVFAQVLQQGFSYINNIDSIVHAILDPFNPSSPARAVSLTGLNVTLISIGNCLGRLMSGIISDWVINRYRVSRSVFFFVSEALILIPLLIMGFSQNGITLAGLYVCSWLIGATYGATGALFASMTRDFFGERYYGTNCGMVMVLNGANPFIANAIYGTFYDRAVENMPADIPHDGPGMCVGTACYDTSFRIASLVQLVCVLSAGLLFWARIRKGKKILRQKAEEEQQRGAPVAA